MAITVDDQLVATCVQRLEQRAQNSLPVWRLLQFMTLQKRAFLPDARGPLEGIRVLDLFSRLVCGNTFTLLPADYGADVIKVESPPVDTLRAWQNAGVEVVPPLRTIGRTKARQGEVRVVRALV